MSIETALLDGAFALASKVAEAISKETGVDKAVTYPIAIEAAKDWVAKERAAITHARDEAIARMQRKP